MTGAVAMTGACLQQLKRAIMFATEIYRQTDGF